MAACAQCGTDLGPGLLSCPSCQTLVHSGRLKELAAAASAAHDAGDRPAAMARWREVLELLPRSSAQYATVAAKLEQVAALPEASGSAPASSGKSLWRRSLGLIIAAVILVVTKGKFLLAGLLKLPTLLSMFAAFGVYWAIWGWPFALGLVLTIYIHEMGHVAALVRYGIKASAPMFVPGLGAYVRLHQHLPSVRQDARVGMAGPLWGLGAGLGCLAVGRAFHLPGWLAMAHVTAIINLFNLIPIWQLDGGRAFGSLTTAHRAAATAMALAGWYFFDDGLLLLIGLVAAWQATRRNQVLADPGALVYFGSVLLALGWLASIDVPLPRP